VDRVQRVPVLVARVYILPGEYPPKLTFVIIDYIRAVSEVNEIGSSVIATVLSTIPSIITA
jgi:hypothetical protein